MKIKNTIIILCGLIISGCSGAALVEESSLSEGHEHEEVELTVSVQHSAASFTTGDGVQIELTTAELHWREFNIISEGDDDDCEEGHDATLTLDVTENLLDTADTQVLMGTLSMEHSEYCQYEVVFSSDSGSVVLAGTWQTDTDAGDFAITITDEIHIAAAFMEVEDGETIAHPLHVHEGETGAVVFNNDVTTWFNGVDFAADATAINAAIAANIEAGFSQVVEVE